MAASREHIRFRCIEQLVLLKLLPQKAGKRSCTKTAIKTKTLRSFSDLECIHCLRQICVDSTEWSLLNGSRGSNLLAITGDCRRHRSVTLRTTSSELGRTSFADSDISETTTRCQRGCSVQSELLLPRLLALPCSFSTWPQRQVNSIQKYPRSHCKITIKTGATNSWLPHRLRAQLPVIEIEV